MRRSSRAKIEDFVTPRSCKPIARACTYCDQHRRPRSPILDRKIVVRKSWLRSGSSTDREQRRLSDLRSDEIIASSLRAARKSPSRRSESTQDDDAKRLSSGGRRRVNFARRSSDSDASRRPPPGRLDCCFDASNSTSYCEPAPLRRAGSSTSTVRESSSDHWSAGFEARHRRVIGSEIDSRLARLLRRRRRGSPPPRRLAGGRDARPSGKPEPISCDSTNSTDPAGTRTSSTPKPSRVASGYSRDEDDDRLLEEFSGMSMAESSSGASTGARTRPEPRIVKPRDAMKRAAVKKMLVYPPRGQAGEPLTLFKKWSNIDCHVTGDRRDGFRYTVYYLQKFESQRWQPNPRTGGPFRTILEDCSTTDHG